MELPDVVRNRALADGQRRWIDELPDLVDHLAGRWGFALGPTYDEGTEAFVAAVTLDDGTPAVLKLLVPRHDIDDHEATVLRLAAGHGCPELYADDPDCGALLMERLGPSMFALDIPYEQRLPALCDAAAEVWRPVPSGADELPTTAAKADWLVAFVTTTWDELDRPCAAATVEHAVACATRRRDAHDEAEHRLLHGDVHQWNALRAVDGWKLVDPDGLRGEPEYDLGVILREDPDEPLAADTWATATWMAERYGLDATAIWEWGVIERLSTGLVAERIDLQPVGRELLALADRIAAG